jgi:hypothetical protein
MGRRTNKKLTEFASWIKRRNKDIRDNIDVTCLECIDLREMKYPRPTCEQCGRINLSIENSFIWDVYIRYSLSIVMGNGFGGFSINTNLVEKICEDYGLNNKEFLIVVKRIQVIASELYKPDEKEEEKENE